MLKGRKIQKKKNKTKEEDVRRKKNFEGRKIRKNQKKKKSEGNSNKERYKVLNKSSVRLREEK